MANATLTLSSKNYSSWSLRGWLLTRFSGLPFEEVVMPVDDPGARAELLLLSPSILVPCLVHDGVKVWDTLAIAEYLNEVCPDAGLLPADRRERAHCRSICGEMHSGFASLRSALPMNLKAHFPGFKVWARAQTDIERITTIWHECLAQYGGPYLFGERDCGGRDVRTGRDALRDLRREARSGNRRVWAAYSCDAGDAAVDLGCATGSRGNRRARCRVLGALALGGGVFTPFDVLALLWNLFSLWFICSAPVRGGTHFLCCCKESKQRKQLSNANPCHAPPDRSLGVVQPGECR